MAPNLKFLDSTPVTSVERKEAKRIGAFTKVVSADFEDEVSKNCVFIAPAGGAQRSRGGFKGV